MRFLGAEYVTSLVRYRIFEAQTSPKHRIFEAEICYFLRTTLGGRFTGPIRTHNASLRNHDSSRSSGWHFSATRPRQLTTPLCAQFGYKKGRKNPMEPPLQEET